MQYLHSDALDLSVGWKRAPECLDLHHHRPIVPPRLHLPEDDPVPAVEGPAVGGDRGERGGGQDN